jgi:S-adenosylmethionine decarboxylase
MNDKKIQLGRHLLVEVVLKEENADILDNINQIKKELIEAVSYTGATIKDVSFVRFEPQGVSGVIVISESHFSVHTWPEYNTAVFDFFTCGNCNPWKAISYLVESLEVKDLVVHEVPRYMPIAV